MFQNVDILTCLGIEDFDRIFSLAAVYPVESREKGKFFRHDVKNIWSMAYPEFYS